MLTDELKDKIKSKYVDWVLSSSNASMRDELEMLVEELDDKALIDISRKINVIPGYTDIAGYLKYFDTQELRYLIRASRHLIQEQGESVINPTDIDEWGEPENFRWEW